MNNSQIKQNDFDIVYSFPSSFLKLDYAYQEKCQAIYNREFGFQ